MTEAQQLQTLQQLFNSQIGPGEPGLGPFTQDLFDFITSPQIWPRFCTAPASAKLSHHHAFDTGLFTHCVDVAQLAFESDPMKRMAPRSVLAVAFLHDLSKIGNVSGKAYYIPNFLKSGSRSDKIPYQTNDEVTAFGTKLASVLTADSPSEMLVLRYMLDNAAPPWSEGHLSLALVKTLDPELYNQLTADERFSIIHHAGAYDRAVRNQLTGNETYLMIKMHQADMLSSRRSNWFGESKGE